MKEEKKKHTVALVLEKEEATATLKLAITEGSEKSDAVEKKNNCN